MLLVPPPTARLVHPGADTSAPPGAGKVANAHHRENAARSGAGGYLRGGAILDAKKHVPLLVVCARLVVDEDHWVPD
jgi:hypothetical protein